MGWIVSIILTLSFIGLLAVLLVVLLVKLGPSTSGPWNVTVMVLGDIGRSPRMQYHALSLAKKGCHVSLVGYPGADPLEEVKRHDRICIHHIVPWVPPKGLPFIAKSILRVLSLCAQLLWLLAWQVPRPRLQLVQTPPAIPALLAALAAAVLRRGALVIDHHNFGYTLLKINNGLSDGHPFVRLYKGYEQSLGRWAHGGFCVTGAMRDFLLAEWRVRAVALHDRPAAIFKPTPLEAQQELFRRLRAEGHLNALEGWWPEEDASCLFTSKDTSGAVVSAPGRPSIIMSATSWTADEPFDVLLKALEPLDAALQKAGARALVAVSGKGELRAAFEKSAQEIGQRLKAVRVTTLWLSFADYAAFLGSADLGLSLHTSSSGLDLPMKVLDMFGAGLPVCAFDFKALPELVQNGENGLIFSNSAELAERLTHGLGLSFQGKKAQKLSKIPRDNPMQGWDANWDEVAWPYLSRWLDPGAKDKSH